MALDVKKLTYPSKATLLFIALWLLSKRQNWTSHSYLKNALLFLCLLNWQTLPFIWHWHALARPLLIARFQQLKAYLGLHSGRTGSRARELGVSSRYWHLKAIGRSPFDVVSQTVNKCGWGYADFMLHMSNSVYPACMDFGRAAYAITYFGPCAAYEKVFFPVGGISTVFLKEISLFEEFLVESRIAGWNDRWGFALTVFTIASKPSKKANKDVIVKTSRGNRTLCCLGLSKVCFKIPGCKQAIKPSRVFSACGFGPNADNWEHAASLRKQGGTAATDWLISEDQNSLDGLEVYAEQNAKSLEIISRLGGGEVKSIWLELLDHVNQNSKQ